jgi:hypothetical protein
MGNSSDLTHRVFTLASMPAVKAAVLSIKGMTERELIMNRCWVFSCRIPSLVV